MACSRTLSTPARETVPSASPAPRSSSKTYRNVTLHHSTSHYITAQHVASQPAPRSSSKTWASRGRIT